uniref:Uncharacterized protein n=1 Tax=Solanum lycopersicum TaxID=4081 RepID=A0A3Q7ER37_SOLLC
MLLYPYRETQLQMRCQFGQNVARFPIIKAVLDRLSIHTMKLAADEVSFWIRFVLRIIVLYLPKDQLIRAVKRARRSDLWRIYIVVNT